MKQSVLNTFWFRQIFIFFQNYQNQGQSTEGKEERKERNDDKKKNQIRICLLQVYPIYKIKDTKKIQNNFSSLALKQNFIILYLLLLLLIKLPCTLYASLV